jgi:hypothetical protein
MGGGGGRGGEMNQALYAHMNNKRKKNAVKCLLHKNLKQNFILCLEICQFVWLWNDYNEILYFVVMQSVFFFAVLM